MKTFIAVVHSGPASAFGIHFPDLPGCFSAADRFEDIWPNAREALALWFENGENVEPRDLAGVAAEVADDLAAGAFLIAVTGHTQSAVEVVFDSENPEWTEEDFAKAKQYRLPPELAAALVRKRDA